MKQEVPNTRKKIILAVINCIEREGIQSITTRKIASEAYVNIAAINYYFGTKENLIYETFKYINDDVIMDTRMIIKSKEKSMRSIINDLLTYIIDGCINYPNLLKAIFYKPFTENDYNDQFITRINDILEELYNQTEISIADENKSEIKKILVEMISSILFLMLFPDYFKNFWDVDFKNEESKKSYIKRIEDKIVRELGSI